VRQDRKALKDLLGPAVVLVALWTVFKLLALVVMFQTMAISAMFIPAQIESL